jgi:hypothetical protein
VACLLFLLARSCAKKSYNNLPAQSDKSAVWHLDFPSQLGTLTLLHSSCNRADRMYVCGLLLRSHIAKFGITRRFVGFCGTSSNCRSLFAQAKYFPVFPLRKNRTMASEIRKVVLPADVVLVSFILQNWLFPDARKFLELTSFAALEWPRDRPVLHSMKIPLKSACLSRTSALFSLIFQVTDEFPGFAVQSFMIPDYYKDDLECVLVPNGALKNR